MSSRDIEGENPLYLPQAKVYASCCGLGPGIALRPELPSSTGIEMSIERAGVVAFSGRIAISQIKRPFDELAGYLYRDNDFPKGAFLLTGTGIVPPNDFTLQSGDRINIAIEGVGTLVNWVA